LLCIIHTGVQSVYEDIARDTNRGHTVKAVMECFHLAKDAGFKVVTHMMPDLPNSGMERFVRKAHVRICFIVAGLTPSSTPSEITKASRSSLRIHASEVMD